MLAVYHTGLGQDQPTTKVDVEMGPIQIECAATSDCPSGYTCATTEGLCRKPAPETKRSRVLPILIVASIVTAGAVAAVAVWKRREPTLTRRKPLPFVRRRAA